MAKARILVVEDEALVARDLVNTVKSFGYGSRPEWRSSRPERREKPA